MAIPQLNFQSQVAQRTLPNPPRREESQGPLSGFMEQMMMAQQLGAFQQSPSDQVGDDPNPPSRGVQEQGLPFDQQVQGPQGNPILSALRSVNFQ